MFNFGENWRRYSNTVLDSTRVDAARENLVRLVGDEHIRGRRFLDVGCGSGIVSIAAARCSAKDVIGIDINPEAIEVSRKNAARYGPVGNTPVFMQCSILDTKCLASLGHFEIVYAWGSLHHTGHMWDAIVNAASLVAPEGILALAIYNHHITSPAWKVIKWSYNWSPRIVQRAMYYGFVPIIAFAKMAATGDNPLKKERGMDFFVDVVDWIGGYPYEYAAPEKVVQFLTERGFLHMKTIPGRTPTACNEYIFQRAPVSQPAPV